MLLEGHERGRHPVLGGVRREQARVLADLNVSQTVVEATSQYEVLEAGGGGGWAAAVHFQEVRYVA
jgi:hypothetical protein